MITVFKNIKDSKNPHYTSPDKIYQYIKNGRYKDKIEAIRLSQSKDEKSKLKGELPSICWSGEFEKRANSAIKKHSGLVCIDFDHVLDLEGLKGRICKDQYTYMAFISPSGDGLKVIMKIPESIDTHADSCRAITDYFNEDTLDEFKDIARVCYISYDPNIYINHDSKVFVKLLKEKVKNQQVFYPTERVSDTAEIYKRIIEWINKTETYGDGNKHSYLVKLSAACLRFGIPEYETCQRLFFDFANKASAVSQKDIDKIVNTVYRNYSNTSCTAHFETTGKPVYTATKEEIKEEIFQIDATNKDIIYLDNVRQSMFEGFKTGKAKGHTTYYTTFDKHWTWRKKEVSFIGGIGNIGKTTMINNLCLLMAMFEGWKFAIFSPEQDPPDDFYNDLIHTYVGKSTEPYHSNQMNEMEYKEAMKFIETHFFYVYPDSESPTPEYINKCFDYAIEKHGVDVCIVDPFNQLDNDWKKHGRDDLYISEFLSKCKRFSQDKNVAYMIAGHPKNSLQKVGGNYEMPTYYDFAGGAMWLNKCDNILVYHRPFAITDPQNTECYFVSQKIKKRKLTGVPGQVTMNFDIYTNRFVDENGNCPFEKYDNEPKQQIINTNDDLTHDPDAWLTSKYNKDDEAPF